MVKFLLDTNICIYLMKNQPVKVAERFAALRVGDVSMSSITLAELEHGVLRQPELMDHRRAQLDRLLERIPSLPFDPGAARCYGELRNQGGHLGRNRFDTLIAAHAVSRNLTLVTNNTDEFKGISGLRLENWID